MAHMQKNDTSQEPSHTPCDQAPPTTTYWTEWYSASNDVGSDEQDFRHLCNHTIITQCREKYTHRSLDDTDPTPDVTCNDGILVCDQSCKDVEVRLLCKIIDTVTVPEPDLHWSLSEIDGGEGTLGAIGPWTCKDTVERVKPINGSMVGEVVQGKSLRQVNGPPSHDKLCAVRATVPEKLAFKPYLNNCLTNPECCDSHHSISVMFWFSMKGNETRPQLSPLHVFRSPSLVGSVQNGNFIVTYLRGNTEWAVNETLLHSGWTHVTITFDLLSNLTVYFNGAAVAEVIPTPSSTQFDDVIKGFQTDNTSFWVLSSEDNVTSSDIPQIAMTDLKVFYSALSASQTHDIFRSEHEDASPRVLRMAARKFTFMDSVETDVQVTHIKLSCLIRGPPDVSVRFMYESDHGYFAEVTSHEFYMLSFTKEDNDFRVIAVLHIYGKKDGNTGYLSSRFTCEVVSNNRLSAYGYPVIETPAPTDLDDNNTYYWTRFFNVDTDMIIGDEVETIEAHRDLAENHEEYDLCSNPIYAECRALRFSLSYQPWYESSDAFVPDSDYPCNGKGIRCSRGYFSPNVQECPDLKVRYVCPVVESHADEVPPSSTSTTGTGTPSNNANKNTDGSQTTTRGGGVGKVTDVQATASSSTTNNDVDGEKDQRSDGVTTSGMGHDATTSSDGSSVASTTGSTSSSASTSISSTRLRETSSGTILNTRDPDDTTVSSGKQFQDTSTSTPSESVSTTPDVTQTNRVDTESSPDETSQPVVKETTVDIDPSSTDSNTEETSTNTDQGDSSTNGTQGNKDSDKSTGYRKTLSKDNKLFLYPVMILALGIGIPTITACYYLLRKQTPEEIEEKRLIEERKQRLANEQKSARP
ncbi:uncharacterized protein LOC129280108 [Lytechinus pictus]|uniref:uncharacterized protein LOC129280108 n=1 Tax=Lytechinus pictus TaxID=7653 RepID=UPI0030B9D9E4